ncbi:hypothetical protein NPIL_577161 [Nephila pilipes]|uniref:Uncharacterized protein n=1 Tax=Nephila pilipes TaxID=299642 RepID=A0A8X6NVM1_NEPPI|nr:hypothetical protein NPIL_577161 [Nephila pilipes]
MSAGALAIGVMAPFGMLRLLFGMGLLTSELFFFSPFHFERQKLPCVWKRKADVVEKQQILQRMIWTVEKKQESALKVKWALEDPNFQINHHTQRKKPWLSFTNE